MKDLRGKKAVVTGGAMGFGFETSRRLLREGCDVTIWDMNASALDEALKKLAGIEGAKLYGYTCDVSDRARVSELVQLAKKDMGQVDILVNNAGFVRTGHFCELPVEHTLRQMEVNIGALFYSTHAFLPGMLERDSGHVVNLASGASWYSAPGLVGYCTSKAAVHGFSETLRIEIKAAGKKGVGVTSVHPGVAVEGMFEGLDMNPVMKALWPPLKDHDIVAEAIVEDGIKKGKSVVCRPRSVYLIWALRGVVPNSVWDWLMLLLGAKDFVKGYKGRPGMAHTDPSADKRPE